MNYPVNPILPIGTFIPDVEAHVWEDGRIYLYGSMDIGGRMDYCSDVYHVYSSDDMVNWIDHGVSFSLSQAEWAKGNTALYAPDCAYRNGKYYLYYCVQDGRCGVAVSDTPTGPFTDVGPIEHLTMIDPAVFIDDDGQAYIYWGQFDGVRAAKLRENMTEIDPDTITQPLSVAEHEFHEGASVKKIGGKYYFVYTDTHRHCGRATSIGYAVSDNPMSGFEYKGVIVDNFGCDPMTWNNHGSIQCYKGQWYVFYHRSTHGSIYSRHVCIEPIDIFPDGTIREVKMTTSCGTAFPAYSSLEAFRAAEMSGKARIAGDSESEYGFSLSGIESGDTVTYRYLEFFGETVFSAVLKTDGGMRAELYIDGWYAGCVSTDPIHNYTGLSADVSPITGTHEITLKFFGEGVASLDSISFGK
ncbi:MAG: family 43 glycosylhydrolase [Clostridia bacterium]|nr:family 43 glycosylhydrolase [Clostridia bacterium]